MQLYRAELAYKGGDFFGFQSQPHGNTIQDEIQRAFLRFFHEDVTVLGASRTDSGVHAEHQVITFRTNKAFELTRWLRALNSLVPPSIGFRSIEPVKQGFNPILDAQGKAYRYRLWQGYCDNPFIRPFVWSVQLPINIDLLKKNAVLLQGEHDFLSFCAPDFAKKNSVRKIYEIKIDVRHNLIDIWFVGEGFLKQMVRIIVGTLVDQATGQMPNKNISEILSQKSRKMAGRVAPACGLTLVEIFYNEILTTEQLIKKAEQSYAQSISF